MMIPIPPVNFDQSLGGKKVSLYTLKSKSGITAEITNYGATLVSLWTPDKLGNFTDIVLGYDSLSHYIKTENQYFGKTVGRYCNRIANAEFTIDGKRYHLDKNDGNHQLHGGHKGFHNVVWEVVGVSDQKIELQYSSPDGTAGFPGNLQTIMTYTLEGDSLKLKYQINTDKTTHINVTNHSYFNLEGHHSGTSVNHRLQILASHYTPTDKHLIPTGEIAAVTPRLDFNKSKRISRDLSLDDSSGYDHNYLVEGKGLRTAAILSASNSGRILKLEITEPGLQFYTGQGICDDFMGKQNARYTDYAGVCLEPQHVPDSPNQDHFPSTLLRPEQTYRSETIYNFLVS